MISKKALVPALVIAAVSAGAIFRVSLVEAVTSTPKNELVQYLSQKLGIDQTKVQSAVDSFHEQQRSERQKQMTENLSTYLSGLVKEGKITETQKTAILNKYNEVQKSRASTDWSSKTPAERLSQSQKDRAELEAWAKQQGINLEYLRMGFGGRGDKGIGRRGGMMRGGQF